MLKLYESIPDGPFCVAVSGGIDSMVLAEFLHNNHASQMNILHVNHGTPNAYQTEAFVRAWALKRNLPIMSHYISTQITPGMSAEEFWRNERYSFFKSTDVPVLLGHHLNDAVETWIFSCANGTPKTIPYRHANCIRPFLLVPKSEILRYANNKQIKYVEDQSNFDVKYARNRIRHNILPEMLKVNPGLLKVVKKKILSSKET